MWRFLKVNKPSTSTTSSSNHDENESTAVQQEIEIAGTALRKRNAGNHHYTGEL